MKIKHRMKRIITLFIIFGILAITSVAVLLCISEYIKASARRRIISIDEAAGLKDVDCILILGAGVWDGGKPSYMLEDRLKQGIKLYESGVSDRLLMSGDHGRAEYDEVNVMKQYAIDAGIASGSIFMDHAGFSTYDSLYRAHHIFKADKVVIVTQEYHLYRALYTAGRLGIDAYGVSADLRPYAGQASYDKREILARVKDFVYTILKPEPKYLGEVIPVSGDGDLTND